MARRAALPARIAGAVMMLDALVLAVESARAAPSPAPPGFGLSVLFDLVFGAHPLSGRERFRSLVVARLILGVAGRAASTVLHGDYVRVLAVALLTAPLFCLLAGRPGPRRVAIGIGLAVATYLLEIVGAILLTPSGHSG